MLDQQATLLMRTNYVYHYDARYRRDLVKKMPEGKHLPSGLEATATFVRVDDTIQDEFQSFGPASSTTAAAQENETAEEFVGRMMSVLDENIEDAMESSKLPILQMLYERMEDQAGSVLANEVAAKGTGGDHAGRDDGGRSRLQWVCQHFHSA